MDHERVAVPIPCRRAKVAMKAEGKVVSNDLADETNQFQEITFTFRVLDLKVCGVG